MDVSHRLDFRPAPALRGGGARSVALALMFVVSGCKASEPAVSDGDLEARAERILTDETGSRSEQAWRSHVLTDGEARATALFWAAAITSDVDGEYSPILLRWDAERYFLALAERYPELADAARAQRASAALISDPPSCSDDCSPGFDPVRDRIVARWEEIQAQARAIADAVPFGDGSEPITDEAAESAVPRSRADAFLVEVARIAALAGALARVLGLAPVAADAFALAGGIGAIRLLGGVLRGIRAAVSAYQACLGWQSTHCAADAGLVDSGSGMDARVDMDAGTCMTPVGPETCSAATRCLSCGAAGGCFDPAVTCCGGDQLAAATDVCLDCGAGPRVYPRGSTCDDAGRADGGRDAGMDGGRDAGEDAGRDAGMDAGRDSGEDAGRDAGCDVTLPPGFACPTVVCPPEPEPADGGPPIRFAPACDIHLTCDCPLGYACLTSSTPADGGGLRGYRTCCLWDGSRAFGGMCPTTFRCPAGYVRVISTTTDHSLASISACVCYSGATWDFVDGRPLERICSLPI